MQRSTFKVPVLPVRRSSTYPAFSATPAGTAIYNGTPGFAVRYPDEHALLQKYTHGLPLSHGATMNYNDYAMDPYYNQYTNPFIGNGQHDHTRAYPNYNFSKLMTIDTDKESFPFIVVEDIMDVDDHGCCYGGKEEEPISPNILIPPPPGYDRFGRALETLPTFTYDGKAIKQEADHRGSIASVATLKRDRDFFDNPAGLAQLNPQPQSVVLNDSVLTDMKYEVSAAREADDEHKSKKSKTGADQSKSTRKEPVIMGDLTDPWKLIAHADFTPIEEPERRKFTFVISNKNTKNAEEKRFIEGEQTESEAHEAWLMGVALRMPIDEPLRTIAHRETAYAMLDGIAIGEFRVKHGTRTLAEYRADKMCICDSVCCCSRVCTRFADLECPCSAKLSLLVDLPFDPTVLIVDPVADEDIECFGDDADGETDIQGYL